MAIHLLVSACSFMMGNIGAYLIITKIIKRPYQLFDFVRCNVNMGLFMLIGPSFHQYNVLIGYTLFALLMAAINVAMDYIQTKL